MTPRRWWRSTGPSRSVSRSGLRRGSPRCPTILGSTATARCTRRASSCCAARVTSTAPRRRFRPRSSSRPTRPSAPRCAGAAARARSRAPASDSAAATTIARDEAVAERRVAARAGEHRDGDRDAEHAAELAQHAVDARGLADRCRRDGVDRGVGRPAAPSTRRSPRSSAPGPARCRPSPGRRRARSSRGRRPAARARRARNGRSPKRSTSAPATGATKNSVAVHGSSRSPAPSGP